MAIGPAQLRRVRLLWCLTAVTVAIGISCRSAALAQVEDAHLRTARNAAAAMDAIEMERSSNGVHFAWDVRTRRR